MKSPISPVATGDGAVNAVAVPFNIRHGVQFEVMGLQLDFADSFAHYNTAGIGLKWTTAGGAIETNPSRVRTGLQSLRIQAGDSPTKVLNGDGYNLVGFGWQTEVLSGETIVNLISSGASPTSQLYLVQNSDGSISLWSGQGPTLLATSAPGVLTVNAWYAIEINVQQIPAFVGPVQCIVTVTPAVGTVTQIINVTGFVTSDTSWDTLEWGGPAAPYHAWVADFYFMADWDSLGDPLALLGAPQIYGRCVPLADGLDHVSFNTIGKTIAFPGTAAPWWSQVNEIPQNSAAPIFETDESVTNPGTIGGWIVCGQCFQIDVSTVPVGSAIAALQVTILYGATAGTNRNNSVPSQFVHYTGTPSNYFVSGGGNAWNIAPNTTLPFKFYEFGLVANPITNLPWVLAEFSGASALQVGPFVGEPA